MCEQVYPLIYFHSNMVDFRTAVPYFNQDITTRGSTQYELKPANKCNVIIEYEDTQFVSTD